MGSNRRMDHMTWPEFKEAKTRPVIVPIGSTEQHGQHLPIGTDAVLATRVAEDLAERIDGTVLPTLSYGYKSKPLSGGGPLFPGTIDMNGVTVINQMHDVLSELIADGFTKIVVMNAHFENEASSSRPSIWSPAKPGEWPPSWKPIGGIQFRSRLSTRCSMDWCSPAGHWSMRPSPKLR